MCKKNNTHVESVTETHETTGYYTNTDKQQHLLAMGWKTERAGEKLVQRLAINET